MKSHYPRKRFGQNFLTDLSVIEDILGAVNPSAGESFVEIGPGQGALTTALLQEDVKLSAIEIDRDLVDYLQRKISNPNFTLISQDVLKVDFQKIQQAMGPQKLRVIGNLPYNISTPLLFHLFEQIEVIEDCHIMLQQEVAQRIAAKPGNKQYGRLTVMCQYFCKVELLLTVPPDAFEPAPKVTSTVLRLKPHHPLPIIAKDFGLFSQLVAQAFSQRRKILKNAVKLLSEEQIVAVGLDPNIRPEQVSVHEFIELANHLSFV